MVNIKMAIKTSIDYKRVSHSYSLRLHRVVLCINKLAEAGVVKVRNLSSAGKTIHLIQIIEPFAGNSILTIFGAKKDIITTMNIIKISFQFLDSGQYHFLFV